MRTGKVQMDMRYSSLRPVHRIKHVRDFQTAVPVNTPIVQIIAHAKDAPVIANTQEVETGAKINGFFITVEVVASETSTTATPNFYFIIYKNPGNNLGGWPNGNAVGSSDLKRFVFHQEMVMINALDGGSPRNLFKGVVAIPKGARRMGPDDTWNIQLFTPSTGVAVNACGQIHYKEFR